MNTRFMRVVFAALLCSAALGISLAHAQTLTSSQTGTHDGYYYSFWTDGGGVFHIATGRPLFVAVEQCRQLGGR